MIKWEYSRIDLNSLARGETEIDALNAAGAQGWELVAVNDCNIAILKRSIAPPAPAPARATRAQSAATAARVK